MKKYIYIIAALVFALTSCDDYLDKHPENEKDVETVDYTNTNNMYQPVSGSYATIRSARGFGSWSAFGIIAVRGDDTDKGSSPGDQIEFNSCKAFEYNKIVEFWALNATWENLYYTVQVCNSSLEMLADYREHISNEADLKLNDQYVAEVKFLRAYTLFYLARLWGDIPLLVDNSQVVSGLEKTSHEEVLKYLSTDLDECVSSLPNLRPNEMPYKGQVTAYSALALKAKIEADLGNWDAVLSATNTIYESNRFQLYEDYYQSFKKPGRLSDESLFELQYSDFNSSTGDLVESDNWFAFQGPRGNIAGVKPISSGWGFMVPSAKLIELFTKRNETIRATTLFLYAGQKTPDGDFIAEPTAGEPSVYNGKVYLPSIQLTEGRMNYGTGNNIRMLRYADVLLLNAEAKVRKGLNGDEPLNLVRERAQMEPLRNATIEDVMEERRVEMACEWGERFFDLVRTGKAATTLPGFVEGESEFYPVPQGQLDINPEWK